MSSDLKVTNIKHASSGSNNLVLASDGNVSLSGSLSAGTIGDNVNLSNSYYLHAKVTGNFTFPSAGRYINTTGTTNPYFTFTGDTTNLLPDSTNNIKIIRKGIYLINFNGTFKFGSTSVARLVGTIIHGGTSVNPTTELAGSYDQIASTVSGEDHASATASYIGELPANYYIRFFAESVQAGEAILVSTTHASITLIRPTA